MVTYRQPFQGEFSITQKYGEIIPGVTYNNQPHTGIDYGCPVNTQILASGDGTVRYAGWDNTGYGLCVIIQHTSDRSTLYAHLNRIFINKDSEVKQGQPIGLSGASGNATGPHLHFEARHIWNDYKSHFDPMQLPLMTVDDAALKPEDPAECCLKAADDFQKGDIVEVVAPLGAKGFTSNTFSTYIGYPQGSEFYYSGKTEQHNGYTYMECFPLQRPVWIAVNDGDTQILDK